MIGSNINFDDKKIGKSDFYKNQNPFQLVDIDVNKVLVAKKQPFSTYNALKYFIVYNDSDVTRPLCLRLSKMTGYINKLDNKKLDNKKLKKKT